MSMQMISDTRIPSDTLPATQKTAFSKPTVLLKKFYSFANLCDILQSLDEQYDHRLGVSIEMPIHFDPHWQRLCRTHCVGGQLAVVVPGHARLTLPMIHHQSRSLEISGWDSANLYPTLDRAIGSLLDPAADLDRCVVLHAEWHDTAPVLQAIGRHSLIEV